MAELVSDITLKNNINNDLEFIEDLTRVMLSEYKTGQYRKNDSSRLVEISRIIKKSV